MPLRMGNNINQGKSSGLTNRKCAIVCPVPGPCQNRKLEKIIDLVRPHRDSDRFVFGVKALTLFVNYSINGRM